LPGDRWSPRNGTIEQTGQSFFPQALLVDPHRAGLCKVGRLRQDNLWGHVGSFQDLHCQPKRHIGVIIVWQ